MKLVNCKVGTKVVIKSSQVHLGFSLRFYSSNVGQVCTITEVDVDGSVRVQVDSTGYTDTVHHTNLRKYKGETA